MTAFEKAFAIVVGEEGGFGADPRDPGKWTSGRCGVGACKGTRFGISAASYPQVDIAGLSLDGARAIYLRDYWNAVRGDALPPALALLVFDSAVNNGAGQAIRWLQSALGVAADGSIGPHTLDAVARAAPGAALLAEFQATRLMFMAGLPTWRTFGRGWARRLCSLPYETAKMEAA